MIKSFKHKGVRQFFTTGSVTGIQASHKKRLQQLLGVLDRAKSQRDMALPGFDLHPLRGNETGVWSVSVNGNWRLTFEFDDGDAILVDYRDYH
ncbi:type II toxin-antitoxin system RelE/ParE family toxin [Paraburkholderia bannensis]|uniref:type II toxin-antitoxin system RelE/ParE family toxin n=1 Tax=Paraburkholderia bannensis TaxID=765414 RepID=UPI002ABE4E36|nr:type II toxin-antitoxin system RelE/ParE family toxin [Paraburkholderia bannensis]